MGYLGIDKVGGKLDFIVFWTRGHDRAEPEEDVESHGIDPEHEGGDGVEGDIANWCTGCGVVWKKASEVSTEEATWQTNVGNEVIENKTKGDLSKEWTVEVTINQVRYKSDEKEDGWYEKGHRVEDEGERLEDWNLGPMINFT